MLTHQITEEEVQEMRSVWEKWHTRLRGAPAGEMPPNGGFAAKDRRSGKELIDWLQANYPVTEFFAEEALACVRDNVLRNEHSREKLPPDTMPEPRAFYIEKTGNGAALYTPEVQALGIERIFVGIDEVTGEFQVESSEPLWDALFVFRGLDEQDIENPFLVWQYVKLKENGK